MAFLNRFSTLTRHMGTITSRAGPSSSSTMASKTLQLIDSTIDDNFIAVFSKSYCPYCKRAKNLINSLELPEGKTVKIYELDQRNDGSEIQRLLLERTGQDTVPNIFINKEHIGGSDDLAAAERSGKLKKIIAAAAAE